MGIEELDLVGAAKAGAQALKKKFPNIEFTSGRRNAADQARAMASNIVHVRNWIAKTYAATPESKALQAWVNAHPQADTKEAIAAGLAACMKGWSDEQKSRLSKHFSGHAFDIQPLPKGQVADQIKAAVRALPGLVKFLETEGGLVRWHAQFK